MSSEEKTYYNESESVPQPADGNAAAPALKRKPDVRRVVRIVVWAIVGALLLGELLGFRFVERLAICCGSCPGDHWLENHESQYPLYPCAGDRLQTDDYDFFFGYDCWLSAPDTVLAARRYGLVYHEAYPDSWELLYDDNGEPAFNLIVFKGRHRNYYVLDYLRREVILTGGESSAGGLEILHLADRITVNGETMDLYKRIFFTCEDSIDTLVLEDGTVVHPETCRREAPMPGALPAKTGGDTAEDTAGDAAP